MMTDNDGKDAGTSQSLGRDTFEGITVLTFMKKPSSVAALPGPRVAPTQGLGIGTPSPY
jgi:hypothetical protein